MTIFTIVEVFLLLKGFLPFPVWFICLLSNIIILHSFVIQSFQSKMPCFKAFCNRKVLRPRSFKTSELLFTLLYTKQNENTN